MSDFCNPLTDQELLNAKIVYPSTQPKAADTVDAAMQKSVKASDNLASQAKVESAKIALQMKSASQRSQKATNQVVSVSVRGKTSNNISFKFGTTAKANNLI
jgi:hypothetical protein